MVDELHNVTPRDRSRIDVSEERELRYWMQLLHVDAETLRNAIAHAGPLVIDVEQFLCSDPK